MIKVKQINERGDVEFEFPETNGIQKVKLFTQIGIQKLMDLADKNADWIDEAGGMTVTVGLKEQ